MFLPSELKLQIAGYLDPLSSVEFGATCKEHWKLCRPIFQKHAQSFAEAPVVSATDIWRLLRDILQDGSKGWYVTEINLTANWDDKQPSTPVEDVDILQDAAKKLLELYPQHSEEDLLVQEIEEGIVTGASASVIAVLIHHLPNLKTFRMTAVRDQNVLEHLLFRMAAEFGNTANASKLPFQQLRTVALSCYDTENLLSADWILPFLRVPSLRTFAGNMLGGNFSSGIGMKTAPLLPHPRSNIEEFFFTCCQFDASVVEYILTCVHSLKRFTYEAEGRIASEHPYDANVVLKALSDHTWNSLEYLVLIHPSYSDELLFRKDPSRVTEVDLTAFVQLHSLWADWAMLWPEPSDVPDSGDRLRNTGVEPPCTLLDIRDKLPSSLQNLDLGGLFSEEEWEGLVTPLATPNEQTPSLKLEGIRVRGHIKRNRPHELFAVAEGWDSRYLKKVSGSGDGAWTKDAWALCALFPGNG
ncbi:hypothetical protein E8E13_010030 [Curvularia kusanoi]|uniref:F-box domain-containing protein n=1 Tax=Curvularia kusanoi TaxID=90978 RepID=A0A9P4TK80_CURKU|nr:hypothetical protein E8E13_010030 [Curvularia kusanoi]